MRSQINKTNEKTALQAIEILSKFHKNIWNHYQTSKELVNEIHLYKNETDIIQISSLIDMPGSEIKKLQKAFDNTSPYSFTMSDSKNVVWSLETNIIPKYFFSNSKKDEYIAVLTAMYPNKTVSYTVLNTYEVSLQWEMPILQ